MLRTTSNPGVKARSPVSDFNEKRYGKLLSQTMPRVIRTEEENERMLEEIWKLMKKGEENLTPEETRLLELMSLLVEEFEKKAYPIPDSAPHETLRHIMEQRGLEPKDLLSIFGSRGYVSDILSGKREISKRKANQLAEFFNVSVELFV